MACRTPCIGVFADAAEARKADHCRHVTPFAGDFAMKLDDHAASTTSRPAPLLAVEGGSVEGL
jgi:hypothetical protein